MANFRLLFRVLGSRRRHLKTNHLAPHSPSQHLANSHQPRRSNTTITPCPFLYNPVPFPNKADFSGKLLLCVAPFLSLVPKPGGRDTPTGPRFPPTPAAACPRPLFPVLAPHTHHSSLAFSFYSGTISFWPQKIPHPHVTSSPHAEMDPSLHWKLFLETMASDAWLLAPVSSWRHWNQQVLDLWLQGAFIDFQPEEVHIYSSLLWGVLSVLFPQSSSPHSLLRPCSAGSSQKESNVHNHIEEKVGN
ncbi:uncharacterized protein LOC130683863 [Manis pentadactyla]|uniref:uncharacterized protein LOC130683863 n=1 Tax=Manis pentadactyla TaxID=143292 RepID=UPI00255CD782|nr:uncharacterized protein LOC130683863 [Manis pentadactyla]